MQRSTLGSGFLVAGSVSILTGPEGPVQLRVQRFHRLAHGRVSILTGPEGPVQPAAGARSFIRLRSFNPHRPRRAGATLTRIGRSLILLSFNPHRPRRAGATVRRRGQPGLKPIVSILTGPEGPVQRGPGDRHEDHRRFQSSPAPKGRCNVSLYFAWRPAMRACFNPHRPRRAGATPGKGEHEQAALAVSILTGPEGPVQQTTMPQIAHKDWFQSSPAPKGRCNP